MTLPGKQHQYSTLDIAKFKETFANLFNKPQSPRRVVIHIGLRGSWMFNWTIKQTSGVITDHMVRHHSKLVKLLGRHEAVDVDGQIWMWEIHDGKIWWVNMYAAINEEKLRRKKSTRFVEWEQGQWASCRITGEAFRKACLLRRRMKTDPEYRHEQMKDRNYYY